MKKHEKIWLEILEDARWYPSPHNSQPITAKIISEHTAVFYYNKQKGLPAENYGIPFGFVCMGVFLEGLRVCAAARGFDIKTKLKLKDMDFADSNIYHHFGDIELVKNSNIDVGAAKQQLEVFKKRRTSRRPYKNRLVNQSIVDDLAHIAQEFGYSFSSTSKQELIKKIISINQETLFDDLRRDPVYFELMQWLRFNKKEAREKADGLSAETMLMPGGVLKFAMTHRGLWELPIIGSFFKWTYLRTMKGVRQVGWLTGPFKTLDNYVQAGQCFMRQWLYLTSKDVHLHPYGTVITNPHSHKAFTQLVGEEEARGEMAWMLYRFGYSDQPPQSFRRPIESMIINETMEQ